MSSGGDKRSELVNQSHIVYDTGASSFTTYSNTVEIPIVGPVITLKKSTDECEVIPGKPIQYGTIIRNKGNYAAEVDLYDDLPEGMAFVPNSIVKDGVPLPGADLDSGLRLGSVEPGESVNIVFQLMLLPGAEECRKHISNRMKARVSFHSSSGRHVQETVYSNKVSLPVARADQPLMFAKLSVDPVEAAPGDRLRYTLLVGNEGHSAANVVLLAFVPQGAHYVPNSMTIDGGWISGSGGGPATAGVPLGLLEPGARVAVAWEAAIPGSSIVSPGQTIGNRALLLAFNYAKNHGEPNVTEFESNKAVVELSFPVIGAKLKVKPEVSYPDGKVEFTLLIANTGNRSAVCSAERLLIGPLLLVSGSVTVDGVAVPEPGKGERYLFGKVDPEAVKKVQFQAVVSPLVTTRAIRGHLVIQYEYRLNDRAHAGETLTNPYAITILYDDE